MKNQEAGSIQDTGFYFIDNPQKTRLPRNRVMSALKRIAKS